MGEVEITELVWIAEQLVEHAKHAEQAQAEAVEVLLAAAEGHSPARAKLGATLAAWAVAQCQHRAGLAALEAASVAVLRVLPMAAASARDGFEVQHAGRELAVAE
jgi:hypothetical protein